MFALVFVVFAPTYAFAAPGDLLSVSATPSSFTAVGEPITFTYMFQPDNVGRSTTGAQLTQSSVFGAAGLNCPAPVLAYVNLPLVCTATHLTTAQDITAGAIQELAQGSIDVSGLAGSAVVSGTSGTVAANLVNLSASVLAGQTITFNNPGLQLLATGGINLTATSSSGLPVSYLSLDANICVVVNGRVTFLNLGLCIISAGQVGNGVFGAAIDVVQIFGIGRADQTITFNALPDHTLGDVPFTASATASSGQAVSFASDTGTICSVTGSSVTLLAAGTCTIRASQGGNLFFNAAPDVTQSFTIITPGATSQTVSFSPVQDHAFGSAPFTVSASSTSGLAVSFTSDTPSVCTVSGNTVTLLAVGTCTLRASQAGDATYAAAQDIVQSFHSTNPLAFNQTISFAPIADHALGSVPFTVSATASSSLPVTFSADTAATCSVSGSTVTMLAAGICNIRASQGGNVLVNPAPDVTQSFNIISAGPTSQTISFSPVQDHNFGSAPFQIAASASSGLAVTFTSDTPTICSVSGNTVTLLATGTCLIRASQAGNGTYAAAQDVVQSFHSANPVAFNQTITFAPIADHALGNAPFTVSASSSSSLPVTIASDTPGICGVSGTLVTLVATGTCTLRASQDGNGVYNPAQDVTQSFNVTHPAAQSQTIAFAPLANRNLGAGPFAVAATASSGLPVSFTSDTPSICTVSGSTVSLVNYGTCTIRASQGGDSTYAAASDVTQSFQSTSALLLPQTITFNALSDRAYGSSPFAVTATASSGQPVSFGSDTPGVCTVSSGVVSLVAVGTCTIRATQAGNLVYSAAPDVTQSFNSTGTQGGGGPGQPQTISFTQLPDRDYGSAPFTVSGSSNSGLPLTYSSDTPSVCSVSGTTVTLLSAGTCSVRAAQAGNGTYQSAFLVNSFHVRPTTSILQLSGTPSPPMADKMMTLEATITGLNPGGSVTFLDGSTVLAVVSVNNGVATYSFMPSGAGSHTYFARYSGDSNHAASSSSMTVDVSAQPDPAADPSVKSMADDQLDAMGRFQDAEDNNLDDHLANLHTGKRRGVVTQVSINGVPVNALVQPAADDHPDGPQLRLWMIGDVEVGQKQGAYQTNFTTNGLTIGGDVQLTDTLAVGLAAGFGWDDTHIGTDGSRNQSHSGSFMAYGDYMITPTTFLDVTGGVAIGLVKADRYSDNAAAVMTGNREASMVFGSISLTKQERFGHFTFAPYGQIKGRYFNANAYTEEGASNWRFSYGDFGSARVKAALGASVSADIPVSWGSLNLRSRAEYGLLISTAYSEQVAYADDPTIAGIVDGDSNFARTGQAGFGVGFAHNRVNGTLDYTYTTNWVNSSSHLVQASLGMKF